MMNTPNLSLPLLPESIAVGLSEDLLQYFIELKFLLLFFNKPLCIFVNQGLQFLSETTIDDVRRGKETKTSIWEDESLFGERGRTGSLKNLEVILTEEWEEIMSHCIPQYFNVNLVVSDIAEEEEHEVDHVFESSGVSTEQITDQLEKTPLAESEWDNLFSEYLMRMNIRMLINILELCCNYRIPMIWGDPAGVAVASRYSKYLLEKYSHSVDDEKTAVFLRTLKGDELLKSIFELGVVNASTVPISKIVEFREKNRDLLNNFLVSYRSFLTELQLDPLNYRKLVLNRTQQIVEELNTINKELLLLRRSSKYKWLENISEAIFEGAKSGALVALWSLLASPLLLAGELGKSLLSVANLEVKDLKDRKQQEQALIFRSSCGYLWKAEKELSK